MEQNQKQIQNEYNGLFIVKAIPDDIKNDKVKC